MRKILSNTLWKSFCHKLKFSIPFIFVCECCRLIEIVGKVIFWCPIHLFFSNTLFFSLVLGDIFSKLASFQLQVNIESALDAKGGLTWFSTKLSLWATNSDLLILMSLKNNDRPSKFKTMNSVRSSSLALQYHPSTIRLQRYSDLKYDLVALSSI